ncbi:MAG: sialidase family protein, partial [Bacteroidota bacterium]
MMKLQIIISLLLIFGMNVSCQEDQSGDDENFERREGDPVDGIRVAWDFSSMQKLSPRGDRTLPWTGYPRVRRLQDGSLLAVYEAEGNVELIRSDDDGATWSSPELLFEKHQTSSSEGESAIVHKANGELIQLANGDVVAACNYRPQENDIAPFSIAIKRSHDGGETWSDPQVIYEAGKDFGDGCWEPAFLQLPSGDLQVYFANENPYRSSDEQEISMLASEDNGVSWSEDHTTVSFREDRRDGMPVPLLVGDEVLVSIEDNGHDQFKPWIVRNPVDDLWSSPVRGNSSLREYALVKNLSPDVYAGAPYLMKVPSGEVILSYQTNEDRSSNWELSTMEVAIGDTTGRNFSKYTHPFDVPLDSEAKWNSISLWDESTVVAASTTSFRSQACEVWIKKGHIIPELVAGEKEIDVDGDFATGEWSNELPVFVGRKSPVNM